jgi:type VI secretion system secreted protein VgrG
VYWQVGSSATVGKGSIFVGKIMAPTSVTLNGGTSWQFSGAKRCDHDLCQETVDGPHCANAGTADGDSMAFSQN